jgi:ABC-type nickel/cobalt efflux system permease component RcnA
MLTLLSIIAIGFFLGMRHATDPDHVIAVTTIVSRQRNVGRAALVGVFWGLGHTLTIFAVGSAIILFNLVIPTRVGLSMELSVGIMLIVLGIWNVVSFLRAVPGAATPAVHSHAHDHDGHVHIHEHAHAADPHAHPHQHAQLAALDQRFGNAGSYQLLRPLLVGIVHGLAGSAAVALLILASIQNSRWAIAYLLVFGVGTIAGMMLITMSLASTFHFVGNKFERFSQRLAMASGLISVAFGLLIAYQICVTQGLLTGNPHWTPR